LYTKEYVVVSAVKRVEFVSDRLSYIVLKDLWYNITIVNVHAPSQEKSDASKDSFYDELEQIFDNFPTYNIKILLLWDFNAELGKEYILKPTTGRVYIRIVMIMALESCTSENVVVKTTIFPHLHIHKCTWASLMGRLKTRLTSY